MTSDLSNSSLCILNPASQCTLLPTYATAVSNPFHPVLKKCPDSVPMTQQSHSGPPSVGTVCNPVTTETVTTGAHGNYHQGNKDNGMFLSRQSTKTNQPTLLITYYNTSMNIPVPCLLAFYAIPIFLIVGFFIYLSLPFFCCAKTLNSTVGQFYHII